jgi:hypothetical protein
MVLWGSSGQELPSCSGERDDGADHHQRRHLDHDQPQQNTDRISGNRGCVGGRRGGGPVHCLS